MHAAVLHTLGKPPRFESFPDPVAEPDEAIVHVRAASLKPIDRLMASGGHYASPREFPVVCGVDGIGVLDDGTRVFFGGPRRPYGAMAERTVVARSRCWPVRSRSTTPLRLHCSTRLYQAGFRLCGGRNWRRARLSSSSAPQGLRANSRSGSPCSWARGA